MRSRLPAKIPGAIEEVAHTLDGDALGFGHPDAQDDKAQGTDDGPEEVGTPDMQRVEHVGRDTHYSELEKPVQRHAQRVADVSDAGGENLCAVKVGDGAETDRPADGIDKDGGDGSVRGRLVAARSRLQAHVDSHIDVCGELERKPRERAAAATQEID